MSSIIETIDKSGHRYGNFHSYYSFHPAESRIKQFVCGWLVSLFAFCLFVFVCYIMYIFVM